MLTSKELRRLHKHDYTYVNEQGRRISQIALRSWIRKVWPLDFAPLKEAPSPKVLAILYGGKPSPRCSSVSNGRVCEYNTSQGA
jgi:hypothetical protein